MTGHNSFLSQDEVTEIYQEYVQKAKPLEQIIKQRIENNNSLKCENVVSALIERLRTVFIQIERILHNSQKRINQIKLYDHDSKLLFQGLLWNLNKIVQVGTCADEFMIIVKNVLVARRSLLYRNFSQQKFSNSNQLLKVYKLAIQFAQNNDLFLPYKVKIQDIIQKMPYENLSDVFPIRDLSFILLTFRQSKCDTLQTYKNLIKKSQNLQKNQQYATQHDFVCRMDNLMLIGLYKIYKSKMKMMNKQHDNWEQFRKKRYRTVNFQKYFQVLLRVSFRDQPTKQQIMQICDLIKKSQSRGGTNHYKKLFKIQPTKRLQQQIQAKIGQKINNLPSNLPNKTESNKMVQEEIDEQYQYEYNYDDLQINSEQF